MVNQKKVIVDIPAHNAEETLCRTCREKPTNVADQVILVDDSSSDETVKTATALGIETIVHQQNLGYGGNRKTCYAAALRRGADIVLSTLAGGEKPLGQNALSLRWRRLAEKTDRPSRRT